MKDRVPTRPGRVLITPEDPNIQPYYATMQMADEPSEPGTPLNKGTLLTDPVANKFGLTSTATVNTTFDAIFNKFLSERDYTDNKSRIQRITLFDKNNLDTTHRHVNTPYSQTITLNHNMEDYDLITFSLDNKVGPAYSGSAYERLYLGDDIIAEYSSLYYTSGVYIKTLNTYMGLSNRYSVIQVGAHDTPFLEKSLVESVNLRGNKLDFVHENMTDGKNGIVKIYGYNFNIHPTEVV